MATELPAEKKMKRTRRHQEEMALRKSLADNAFALGFASKRLKDHKGVVLAAVGQNGNAICWASQRLKNDVDVVRAAVSQADVLFQTPHSLRDNEDIVRTAVQKCGLAIRDASARLQANKDIVKLAVAQNGSALGFVFLGLRDDEDVVNLAVTQNGLALQHASERLRDHEDVVLVAMGQTSDALRFASKRLRTDAAFLRRWALFNWWNCARLLFIGNREAGCPIQRLPEELLKHCADALADLYLAQPCMLKLMRMHAPGGDEMEE